MVLNVGKALAALRRMSAYQPDARVLMLRLSCYDC